MIIKIKNSKLPNQTITCKGMDDLQSFLQARADQRMTIKDLTFFDRKMKPLGETAKQMTKGTYIVEWPLRTNSWMHKFVFVDGTLK